MTTIQSDFAAMGANVGAYGVETPTLDSTPEPCMPPPADIPSGDIGAAVAALIVINADQQKSAARQLQKSEEALQTAAEQREINAMHTEATLKMVAAVVGIVGSTVDGVAMAAGGGAGSGAAHAGGDIKGVLDGVAGVLQAEATFKAADEKEFANEADSEKRGAQSAGDSVDDAKKLADKAIDFYQQWTQGKAEAAQAATHRS